MIIIMIKDENGRDILINKLSSKQFVLVNSLEKLSHQLAHVDKDIIVFLDTKDKRIMVETLEMITTQYPNTKVVLFSNNTTFMEGYALLKYNIKGYSNILISKLNLNNLIKQVYNGMTWFTPEFITELISLATQNKVKMELKVDISCLTSKELKVAQYVADTLINREIAEKMGVSERTIKSHISSCFEKLGIHDRVSLALAIRSYYNDI